MSLASGVARLFTRSQSVPSYGNRYYPFSALRLGEAQPLSLPAFRSGVDRKASLVASMPVYAEVDGQRIDYVPQILAKPDPSEERFATLHKMVASFVFHGEVVAPITQWDEEGRPQALVVVDPASAQLSQDGQTWTIGAMTLPRSEVLHLVRFPIPGTLRGVGSVQLNRDFFAGVEAQEKFQRDFYLNGGVPSVVVHMAEGSSADDIDEAKRSYLQKLSKREPLFVPGGMKVDAFQLSNVDQQYLESKAFTLQEVANIVGLPGSYVGAPNASQTYANVNDTRRELVDVYLRPDIVLIEAGLSALLPEGARAKLDTNALLRTDPQATAALLTSEMAYKTMNEVRADIGLPPVDGGDVIGNHYTAPAGTDAEARSLSAAETLQKVYLAVGVVITADEARDIVNANGGTLTGPAPAPALPPGGSNE